ncbi:MAG: helix-turn-helix domain-containing protein [Solirubrobacterales bacterium]|nr:helix-turn-helix domain-containing protein [Solirubrobacterales bacterium]HMT05804.1 helix-turn-helix domain-containing protein [Solirubrobacterales bacterium]
MSPAAKSKATAPARLASPVLAGRGLPGLARAASDVMGMPVAFLDRSGIVLAVAGATQAQEKKLTANGKGVGSVDLVLGDTSVGEARFIGGEVDSDTIEVMAAFAALEIERARSDEWGNEGAVTEFVQALLASSITATEDILAGAEGVGCDLSRGGGVLMVRAHAGSAQEGDWRSRVLDMTLRTIRAVASGAIAGMGESEEGALVGILIPTSEEERLTKIEEALERELPRSLAGLTVTISRSRLATGPEQIERAIREARLALNVGEAEGRSPIAFEDTGAYRLLLGTSTEELHSFYAETVEPLVAYDDQYETDLVATVENYLDSDANVPATAKQMFTHRHTIRYRLERVRDLSGHDATATEGRERLGLGIKAMRVLGIASPRGRSKERK